MAITGTTDLGDGLLAVTVDHDPTATATDAPAGSLIIDSSGILYRKTDSGATTNVQLITETSGTATSVAQGIARYNTTDGRTLEDSGIRLYDSAATDPVSPTPADGDLYYNTTLDMMMQYDGGRSKWLSIETCILQFGRNGNTGAGAFYRGMDGLVLSSALGFPAMFNGTIVSIGYTRSDTDSATFQITSGGTTIASLASTATSGTQTTTNGDFSSGGVLAARNASGGNTTSNVQLWVRIKWRA